MLSEHPELSPVLEHWNLPPLSWTGALQHNRRRIRFSVENKDVDGQKIIVLLITNSTRDIYRLETELQTPKICSKEVRVSCEWRWPLMALASISWGDNGCTSIAVAWTTIAGSTWKNLKNNWPNVRDSDDSLTLCCYQDSKGTRGRARNLPNSFSRGSLGSMIVSHRAAISTLPSFRTFQFLWASLSSQGSFLASLRSFSSSDIASR